MLWVTGLGLGFTNSGGTWEKWDMCFCCGGVGGVGGEWVVLGESGWCWGRVGGVGGEWVGGLGHGLGGWGGIMSVCFVSLDCLC